jgi:predicted RecB family nuclease
MNLSASDLYGLYQPSECDLRIWLKGCGEPEAEPSEYSKLLRDLGIRHELRHLDTLAPYTDLSKGTIEERKAQTIRSVAANNQVLYQPALEHNFQIQGEDCLVSGIPDFLILEGNSYVVRDCKMSRHADEKQHYETVLQLGLYGLLFEKNFGRAPARLDVVLGDSTIVQIPFDGGKAALANLARVPAILKHDKEFYEPVGHSKCSDCGFKERCWRNATERNEVSRVYGIEQAYARALNTQGIITVDDLLKNFDEDSLAEFKALRGTKYSRFGLKAKDAILHAKALQSGNMIILAKPAIPKLTNLVAFDIEGLPPQLDEMNKIYLWGTQVFGEKPGPYFAGVTDFGLDGDRKAWFDFLTNCQLVFEEYGDIPFVHWAPYERTNLTKYVQRHGDPKGTASRIEKNLLDLLPITRNSIVLPEPTYSLKVIEKYAGFGRILSEANGQWSMATFIKAVETGDEEQRKKLIDQIIQYNAEDLKATWAVFEWLKGL